jgi:hypothetical protein
MIVTFSDVVAAEGLVPVVEPALAAALGGVLAAPPAGELELPPPEQAARTSETTLAAAISRRRGPSPSRVSRREPCWLDREVVPASCISFPP